jgi:3-phosphoshikimate 1-carboxyvinyltransferase
MLRPANDESTQRFEPTSALVGSVAVPGDRSISNRAVLVGAVGEGETEIEGFGRSAETAATLAAARALGVDVEEEAEGRVCVVGVGLSGLREPPAPIDYGGKDALSLLAGILAGQGGRFELTGDEPLGKPPLGRIAEPRREMGARVETPAGRGLVIEGGDLRGIDHELPLAGAQVKSAVLLAGLLARSGATNVRERRATPDHTELLLADAGARISRRGDVITVEPAERLRLPRVEVPGDFSAAAPFIVAATLLAGSELFIAGVGINPTRTGLLDVLVRMGARITVFNRRRAGREAVADLEVRSAPLTATTVGRAEVPRLIDELPLLALAAGSARGKTVVRGIEEFRAGGSNGVETVTTALRSLGVRASPREDGFSVRGVPTRPRGGALDALGEPGLAVLGAVAGLVSREGVAVEGAEAAAITFPGFFELLEAVAQR